MNFKRRESRYIQHSNVSNDNEEEEEDGGEEKKRLDAKTK